jgi:hypothetical protein
MYQIYGGFLKKLSAVFFQLHNNQKGFLLISVIFIMLLMAVSIFSINYYSSTQIRMASNQTDSVQTGYDLKAIIEQSVWKLTDNLFWRTSPGDLPDPPYDTSYTHIVRNAGPYDDPTDPLFDYRDAVTIQVTPNGASQSLQRSFRYYTKTLSGLSLDHPEKITMTPSGNLLIADKLHHKVIQVNPADTSAINVIAGTGSSGEDLDPGEYDLYYGSNRPRLDSPQAAIYDPSDTSYYIADTQITASYGEITGGWGGGSSYIMSEQVPPDTAVMGGNHGTPDLMSLRMLSGILL